MDRNPPAYPAPLRLILGFPAHIKILSSQPRFNFFLSSPSHRPPQRCVSMLQTDSLRKQSLRNREFFGILDLITQACGKFGVCFKPTLAPFLHPFPWRGDTRGVAGLPVTALRQSTYATDIRNLRAALKHRSFYSMGSCCVACLKKNWSAIRGVPASSFCEGRG